jgi:CRISPR-associated endonuclease/helicase Cas3
MAACAVELANEGGRRVIVFANSRKTARQIARAIEKGAPDALKLELLVGARRVHERQNLKDSEVFQRFSPDAGPKTGAAFLVATSAGEVGVDLDADALVCDLAPWERMVQRLGRVNRRAEPGEAPVIVFDAIEDDDEDAIEQSAEARKAAKSANEAITAAMRMLLAGEWWPAGEGGTHEASPLALRRLKTAAAGNATLRELLERATTPEPLRPALTAALLDAWSMTSLEEHTGRPIVAPWLRGWVDKEPQTRVVWRAIQPPIAPHDRRATEARLQAFFDAAAPHLTEILETYSYEVAEIVNKRAAAVQKRLAGPIEMPPSEFRGEASEAALIEIRGDDVAAVILSAAGGVERYATLDFLAANPLDVRGMAGRTVVLNARLGGLDENGLLDPNAEQAPPALDDDATGWTPSVEEIGFRVRVVAADIGLERGWRVEYRCPAVADDEDGEGDEVRVEVYRGRSDAAGDLAIARKEQTLVAHSDMIVQQIREIAGKLALAPDLARTLEIAARLHDQGKNRVLWQRAMNAPRNGVAYAKTLGGGNPQLLRIGDEAYRHEFGSLREAEKDDELNSLAPELRDLALHLIAAHHGFARPVIPAVDPDEPPAVSASHAPNVARRYDRLQRRWGWRGLAWCEALLRAADWAASARNDALDGGDG